MENKTLTVKTVPQKKRKAQPAIPLRHKMQWTKDDKIKLIALLEHGHGYHYVAHRMKRSCKSVIHATYGKLKTSVGDMRGRGAYSPSWLCNNFFAGKDQKWIFALISHSYLKAYQTYPSPHARRVRTYRISEEELHRFLDNPDYFMLWQPSNLRDDYCRKYCQQVRDDLGWQWLNVKQVAQELGYSVWTVRRMVTSGKLKMVRRLGTGPNGDWWVRSDELDRFKRDLGIGSKQY